MIIYYCMYKLPPRPIPWQVTLPATSFALNTQKFDFMFSEFGGFDKKYWDLRKEKNIKQVQKILKRMKNNNDKLFDSCEIIKVDGAAYACNGLYDKLP